jgi:uncharacterized protein DUF5681
VAGRFHKGQSGNPKGKPRGAKNRSSIVAERLFADEIQEICGSVIPQAKAGNMQAAKIILDRVLPPMKDKPVQIDLPKMTSSDDLVKVVECIAYAVGSGQISPLEGESIARIVDIHIKALELNEIEKRLSNLEKRES